jgi:hypothetical protein
LSKQTTSTFGSVSIFLQRDAQLHLVSFLINATHIRGIISVRSHLAAQDPRNAQPQPSPPCFSACDGLFRLRRIVSAIFRKLVRTFSITTYFALVLSYQLDSYTVVRGLRSLVKRMAHISAFSKSLYWVPQTLAIAQPCCSTSANLHRNKGEMPFARPVTKDRGKSTLICPDIKTKASKVGKLCLRHS